MDDPPDPVVTPSSDDVLLVARVAVVLRRSSLCVALQFQRLYEAFTVIHRCHSDQAFISSAIVLAGL
jgi:hypothetical protein